MSSARAILGDGVYTQIPIKAVKYWEQIRAQPTHALDFIITFHESHGRGRSVGEHPLHRLAER
jgi:hypothetical protein